MNVISTSYGNDSVAMIQWAVEQKLPQVFVVFVDTGWSAPGWLDRVKQMENWVRGLNFTPVNLVSKVTFEELVRIKKGFPNQRFQWCSGILKGLPFLTWIDEVDPENLATILIGIRREESQERAQTPEFIEASQYHGGRKVWHPLYLHTDSMRDALLSRAGFEVLPHRSKECSPCVNANRRDFLGLSDEEILKVRKLEQEVGKTMFRPKRHLGAKGIGQVVAWARAGRGNYTEGDDVLDTPCNGGYCGR